MSNKFKVTTVIMHQALIWPGVCPGDKTISDVKIKGIEMSWNEDAPAIKMTAKGKTTWVPLGSIANFDTELIKPLK
jgi:hypothetical protein